MIKKLIFGLILVFSTGFGYAQTKIDSLKTVLEKTIDNENRLVVLDDLTKELVRNNSDEQAKYLNQYLVLAKGLEEYDLLASKSRFLIQDLMFQRKLEEAKVLCDSFLGFKPFFKKINSEAHLLLKRGGVYFNSENFDLAVNDYENSANLFLESGDSIFAADAIYFKGQAFAIKSNFVEAVNHFKKASNLYEILGDDPYVLHVGSEITALYTQNGFIEKSLEERERLLQKAKDIKDQVSIVQILGQNVADYYKLGDYDNFNRQIDELIKYSEALEDAELRDYNALYTTNYKLIYHSERGDTALATQFFKRLEALSTNKALSKYLEADLLIGKEAYYSMVNDEEKLVPVLEALSENQTTSRLKDQTKAREKLARIYRSKGQLNKAFELNDINNRIKDSVYDAQKTNAFLFYQSEFEAEQKQHELRQQDAKIKQLETEKALAATKRNSLIIGLVLFFLVAIAYFYNRNRQKIKEQAYQNILLNNKVATKTEEINELLTETIQHIKSKERIAENLQKLSDENEDITLKSIIVDLKASKADNAKLMLIKQNIEQVNYQFIKTLKALHPDLTKTDVEICSLIRIGLSRKEVANLRNTSLEAVKTSRFRLKKKLNLSSDQNLNDYINDL